MGQEALNDAGGDIVGEVSNDRYFSLLDPFRGAVSACRRSFGRKFEGETAEVGPITIQDVCLHHLESMFPDFRIKVGEQTVYQISVDFHCHNLVELS